jgi:hypothetical protein
MLAQGRNQAQRAHFEMQMAGHTIRATLERLRDPIRRHGVVRLVGRNYPEYCNSITIECEMCLCSSSLSIASSGGILEQGTESSGMRSILKCIIKVTLPSEHTPVRGPGQVSDGRAIVVYRRRCYR